MQRQWVDHGVDKEHLFLRVGHQARLLLLSRHPSQQLGQWLVLFCHSLFFQLIVLHSSFESLSPLFPRIKIKRFLLKISSSTLKSESRHLTVGYMKLMLVPRTSLTKVWSCDVTMSGVHVCGAFNLKQLNIFEKLSGIILNFVCL